MNKYPRINIEVAENGYIVKVSKETKRKDGGIDYTDETMIFPEVNELEAWLKENAPGKKFEEGKGLIADELAKQD